jgi:hypothetical protein
LDDAAEQFDCRAVETLRKQIVEAIQEEPEKFTEKIRSGISPRQAVYSMLANISGDLLESGEGQMISGLRGALNPMGTELLSIFEESVDEMVRMEAIDDTEATRQKTMLREQIGWIK